ncbi:bifunctional protein HldE [includes: D-beta-D-heptose 7-phosphate kinase; D-beta-D-heptose 1-phosphate adenosyltransferase] [Escherichia coli]|nr:bifunctional protein HldE [includes: D-beta-D-heptose 7-phosphate kinase; D-beta-D-heptose 1-phosphate adenosyltransferase] [Escherichia coli]
MIVLGALEAVDWVVSFEEDTPQRLIAGILPDLLVKGGDYKPEEIAGSKKSGPTAAKCWCSTLKTVARPLTLSRRSTG